MENIEKINLWKVAASQSPMSTYSCQSVLRELVQLSEKYDVIIDNGKVILSEKS